MDSKDYMKNLELKQKVALAVLCAKTIHKDPKFVSWAEKWLNGEDQSLSSLQETLINNFSLDNPYLASNPSTTVVAYTTMLSAYSFYISHFDPAIATAVNARKASSLAAENGVQGAILYAKSRITFMTWF